MKKTVGVLLLALCILLSLCSCSKEAGGGASLNTSGSIQPENTTKPLQNDGYTDKYSSVELTFGYDGLQSNVQRQCYNALEEVYTNVTNDTTAAGAYLTREAYVSGDIGDKDIFVALTAFKYDHPGAFWLKESFTTLYDGGGASVRLCSYYSPEELKERLTAFNKKAEDILAPLEKNMSDFELELYIHDYIMENCEYDSKTADALSNGYSGENEASFTCYGALVEGKAICQGYADAMGFLLSCVGIESTEISGANQEGNHIWNAVKIGGEWYYLDATWDDHGDRAYRYDYFNITASQLEADHSVARVYTEMTEEEITGGESNIGANLNIFVPECTASEYNYYVQRGACLKGFDKECDKAMSEELLAAAENNEEYFHIYADGNYLSFEDACTELFDPYIYHFSEYVDYANKHLENAELDTSAAIVKKEALNVITVKLKYQE